MIDVRKLVPLLLSLAFALSCFLLHTLSTNQWTSLISSSVSPNEQIELGYFTRNPIHIGSISLTPNHQYYVVWRKNGETKHFIVMTSENAHPLLELRMMPYDDKGGFWLVSGRHVVASLDRQSGQFMNSYQSLIGTPWIPSEPEDQGRGQKIVFPNWATPSGGISIGSVK